MTTSDFAAETGYPDPIPKFITRFQIRVTDTHFCTDYSWNRHSSGWQWV